MLPTCIDYIHNMFHATDPTHLLSVEDVELKDSLTYKEHQVQIIDRQVKEL